MKYLSAFWKENRKFMLLLATIVFFKSAIADLNSDGAWDFFDVQMFLNVFSAGCA